MTLLRAANGLAIARSAHAACAERNRKSSLGTGAILGVQKVNYVTGRGAYMARMGYMDFET